MNDTKQAKGYQLGGLWVPIVDPEPCYRLVQIGKGQPVTCQCSQCKARQTQTNATRKP